MAQLPSMSPPGEFRSIWQLERGATPWRLRFTGEGPLVPLAGGRQPADLEVPEGTFTTVVGEHQAPGQLFAKRGHVLELARSHIGQNLWTPQGIFENELTVQPVLDLVPLHPDAGMVRRGCDIYRRQVTRGEDGVKSCCGALIYLSTRIGEHLVFVTEIASFLVNEVFHTIIASLRHPPFPGKLVVGVSVPRDEIARLLPSLLDEPAVVHFPPAFREGWLAEASPGSSGVAVKKEFPARSLFIGTQGSGCGFPCRRGEGRENGRGCGEEGEGQDTGKNFGLQG